tara:strand:+ start:200 stop:406 length:207 start_codon:yes stop_codon:yes gene_type:complete
MIKTLKITEKEKDYLFQAVDEAMNAILHGYDWEDSYTEDGDLVETKLMKDDQKRMNDLHKLKSKIARA